jgi:crotonobetaine/carnitine-CoA ligase
MGPAAKHPDPSITFTEMKIVDDNDTELPVGKVGELVLRSPVLTKVILEPLSRPRKRCAEDGFTPEIIANEMRTVITFVDRKKDIIRRRGENISSVK